MTCGKTFIVRYTLINYNNGYYYTWHSNPMPYAVYVDNHDIVWLSDFGANALVKFDPTKERFEVFPLSIPNANVRQIIGRPGEIWGAESGLDRLVVLRTGD
ncbi:MAG: hypothetical protein WAK17_23165 [Candidatus Nitrosopolaris sp.]